ncbi:MAG TPA: hypothetical protein VFM88_02495 [Vicinamibacteria bacterium]|nr:hypothetical protein [Vicinamibacteria bacterium]
MLKPAALALAALVAASAAPPLRAQDRDEARPRDIQRLQEELQNLDEQLKGLEPGDRQAEDFRDRAEEIREEAIYLKVKMRKHERAGREGTGVSYDEVAELHRSIRDLREDVEAAFGGRYDDRELRLSEGTEFDVRLDQAVSSKTARREDRVEASVASPLRADGRLALPAGTRVRGIVRSVEPAERPSKEGRLELEFDAVYLDRERVAMLGRVTAVGEGGLKKEAGKAGIGATLGAVLGGIFGGKEGAIVGVVLGGTGAVVGTKGEDVTLPAGALVRVRLSKPLVLPRR